MNSCKVRSRSYFVWILQVCAIVSTQPKVLITFHQKQHEHIKDTYDMILQLNDKSISAIETYTTNVFHSQLGDRRTKSKYFSSSHD